MNRRAVAISAVVLAGVLAAPAAGADPVNPRQFCDYLRTAEPEAYEFIATKPGACQSSVASVGVEALESGAFPSTAAAVGNCKWLEENVFAGGLLPDGEGGTVTIPDYLDDGRAYPYLFYWFEGNTDLSLLARNRADCVRLLEVFHTSF